ncbi:hypothetical protein B0T24DRAFT_294488 [Lasiosphaeria ovina]|uniref:Uncharacterized protein n=1 Tax=Lasiosphaeria ovina TaxID=92902 RepID=A0AAE0KEC5_9PEZI|nr:hypothetical protein B0T24DRAFT_294488 [Lasiosphaeria ovina]
MSDTQRARVIATPGSGARSINRVPTYAGLTELGMMFGARRQVSAGKAISESKLCSLPRKEDERDQASPGTAVLKLTSAFAFSGGGLVHRVHVHTYCPAAHKSAPRPQRRMARKGTIGTSSVIQVSARTMLSHFLPTWYVLSCQPGCSLPPGAITRCYETLGSPPEGFSRRGGGAATPSANPERARTQVTGISRVQVRVNKGEKKSTSIERAHRAAKTHPKT